MALLILFMSLDVQDHFTKSLQSVGLGVLGEILSLAFC